MKITWIGIQCCIALKRLIYYILISIDLMAYTSVLNQKWIYANNHDLQKVSKTKSILFQKWQSCHAYSRVVVIHVTNNQLSCYSGQVDVRYTNLMRFRKLGNCKSVIIIVTYELQYIITIKKNYFVLLDLKGQFICVFIVITNLFAEL